MTENTKPITAVHDMTDIVAVVPFLLGGAALTTNRAVMIIGTGGALAGAMAADLPQTGPEAVDTVDLMVRQAVHVGADDAFLVLYPDHDPDAVTEESLHAFAVAFATTAGGKGIDVKGMAMVAPEYWRNYRTPEAKRDLSEVTASQAAASLAANGENLDPALPTVPEPDLASTSLTLAALNFRFSLPAMDFTALTDRDRTVLTGAFTLWNRVVGSGADLTEGEARQLIGYFQHTLARDAMIACLTGDSFDPDRFGEALTRAVKDPDVDWLLRAKAMVTAIRKLLRWTEPDQRPNMLALAAFCEWFMGRGTYADMYLRQGQSIRPDLRLLELLDKLMRLVPLSPAVNLPGAKDHAAVINAN